MIEIRNVYKTYVIKKIFEGLNILQTKNIEALKGITFNIIPNRITALFGNNGAGKTTMLKILNTVILKDGGIIRFNGFDIDKNENYFKKNVAIVNGEERSFYFRLTLLENLKFFMGIFLDSIDMQKLNDILHMLDLYKYRNYPFRVLSSGMKAKMQLARAFIKEPKLLLLDEPFSNIDYSSRNKLMKFLNEWVKEQEHYLLITSHHIEEIEDYIDDVVILKNGKIVKYIQNYEKNEVYKILYKNGIIKKIQKSDMEKNGLTIASGIEKIEHVSPLEEYLNDEN